VSPLRRGRVCPLLPLLLLLPGCERPPGAEVRARGTVEAREVRVAPLGPGRLLEVRVREGDLVATGDTLAILTRGEVPGEVEAARARLGAAEARLRELEAGTRPEDLQVAEAQLAGAEGDRRQAEAELRRVQGLVTGGLATAQDRERAEAAVVRARSQAAVAERTLARLRAGPRRETLEAARAELAAARAAHQQALGAAGDLVLTSPLAGRVQMRAFEPGEVVPAGRAVLVLVDPADLWIRVYVDQAALPRVRVGAAATVVADALPRHPAPGRVTEISPRAEFTPRVALTEEERADLVFAVRVEVRDTTGRIRAGMPAEARIHE